MTYAKRTLTRQPPRSYPQPILSSKLSTGCPTIYPQAKTLSNPCSDRPKSPRSEPNRSENQRHKDSDDSDIVSSDAYSDSEPYVLYSVKVSYTLNSISRVPPGVYSI